MSQHFPLAQRPVEREPDPAAWDPPANEATPEPLFAKLHRLLRVHYKWCVPTAVVLGAAGAYLGYVTTKPHWSSTATIQVRSVVPIVISKTFENQEMPDQFKETQVALMRNQRLIEMAMQSEEWKTLGRDTAGDNAVPEFLARLKVVPAGRSEVINAVFSDEDPKAALAGIRSVVGAYQQICIERNIEGEKSKRQALEARRMNLTREIREKRETLVQTATKDFGTDDLRGIHAAKLGYISSLETTLAQGKLALAALDNPTTRPVASKSPSEMTVDEIALVDDRMFRFVQEREELELQLAATVGRLLPNHNIVKDLKGQIERKQREIERYEEAWRARAIANGPAANLTDPFTLQRGQLEAQQRNAQEALNEAREEAMEIGRTMFELERLKREMDQLDILLAQTNNRLDQLRTEVQDRINIISDGDRPMIVDDKRIRNSVVAAAAAVGFPFGLAILLSLLDRRLRYPQDAVAVGRISLLGVLPRLPESLADPEQAAIAAHCVHQIRTLLQIGSDRRAIAITSPAAGTGKTSLTLSLGVSFAASDCRTLLIDCDLIGAGLTTRVDAVVRWKIGQILTREGVLTEQQLQAALKLAHGSRKKVGEVLIELGYVAEAELDRALAYQVDAPLGMLDVIAGERLADCVAETGIQGLAILPVGAAMPSDVSRLSPRIFRALIEQARREYDVVLIDTGPVPGSLEASVAAAAADGVVLVVSRGEHRPIALRSIQHLQDIGAPLVGLVFNRAEGRDVEIYGTTNRVSSQGAPKSAANQGSVDAAPGSSRMGPMTLAVTDHAPAPRNRHRTRAD